MNPEYTINMKEFPVSGYIHPTAVIYENVTLGDNVYIGAYAVIGGPPEHRDYWDEDYNGVIIGDNVRISNHVTIDAGTTSSTVVGNNSILLAHSHVGHDVILEDNVTISVGAIIGGHTYIMKGANIGLNATIHQNHLIGSYSMVGMGAVVPKSKKVQPFYIYAGNPIKEIGKNQVAIDRNKLSIYDFENENQKYEIKLSH